ncbi:probable palmitoyltransferase ZDHHC24 [Drosophila eugracilis]|uniref:probable palmitoyltransferase ZDHHC24 n=1 Tax=Drosophila eugracilis TaxID=29029 RepID=UPI0007E85517|nr:probable palmitoyltransferase ZDHHC24 [Drosophila eugracilis]
MCFIIVGCKYIAKTYPKQFVRTVHPSAVGLVLVGTAFFFTVEMFFVVPMIFDTGGLLYKFSWLIAIFIVYNLLGNMLACYLTDTSVTSLTKERQIPLPEEEHLWHHCDYCQLLVPPRSWHCKLCDCCILRRDHHCIFTATCIGHNNYRYFFWFTVYMAIGTFLAVATHFILFAIDEKMRAKYLIYHLSRRFIFLDPQSFDAMFFFVNVTFTVNVYALVLPLVMLAYQIPTLYLNTTFYTVGDYRYNLGLRNNFRNFMGSRGMWTFLSPSIKSPLVHDGTQWEAKEAKESVF